MLREIRAKENTFPLSYEYNGRYYMVLGDVEIDKGVKDEPKYEEMPIFIKILLRKKPENGYFINFLNKYKRDNLPRCNEKDRGHFIGKILSKYLLTDEELECYKEDVEKFFQYGNKANVSPQSRNANRGSDENKGQLGFEQEINNYFSLEKNQDAKVYFEIEEIRDKGKTLGRRIFIKSCDEKLNKHIFIPDENQTSD